ncbi:MAG: small subunit ribosomal protein S5 [Akkermansiaceae bacterium]|jgi:small subunit ribosomal protein S5
MANNEDSKPAANAAAKPADANAAAKPGDAAAKPAGDVPSNNRGGDNRGGGFNRGGGPGQGGGNQRGGFGGRPREATPTDSEGNELTEKVVFINRCSKVVKGGRRFSFSALVVSGNEKGSVGYGFGKANEVAECIKKASGIATKSLEKVKLSGSTIPHEVYAEFGGGKVLLKPASPGTGVIAGGGVRAVCEAVGIHDVLAKSIGSNNHANVVKATIKALTMLRSKEEVFALRGIKKEKAI